VLAAEVGRVGGRGRLAPLALRATGIACFRQAGRERRAPTPPALPPSKFPSLPSNAVPPGGLRLPGLRLSVLGTRGNYAAEPSGFWRSPRTFDPSALPCACILYKSKQQVKKSFLQKPKAKRKIFGRLPERRGKRAIKPCSDGKKAQKKPCARGQGQSFKGREKGRERRSPQAGTGISAFRQGPRGRPPAVRQEAQGRAPTAVRAGTAGRASRLWKIDRSDSQPHGSGQRMLDA